MNAAPAPQPSFPRRVADTFAAPRRLFDSFREHAPWFDVLLLAAVAAAVAALAIPAEVFLEQAENPVTRRGEPVTITSPPEEIVRWGRYLAMLSALAIEPLLVFALAGVLALLFSVLGPGQAPYDQYLAVAAHARLVVALGALLTALAQWLTGDPLLELSLGALVRGSPGVVQTLLGLMNPFTLWMLALLALGAARINPGLTTGRAALALGGLYLALGLAVATLTGPT